MRIVPLINMLYSICTLSTKRNYPITIDALTECHKKHVVVMVRVLHGHAWGSSKGRCDIDTDPVLYVE